MKIADIFSAKELIDKISRFLEEKLKSPNNLTRDMQALTSEVAAYHAELQLQNAQLRDSQQQLMQAHDRYQKLYDFAPVGYATFNRLGHIIDLNLTLANFLGHTRDKINNTPFSQWLARGQANRFVRHLNRVFLTHQAQTVELEIIHPLHGTRIVRLESMVIPRAGDNAIACNSGVIDITYEKKVEAELKRSHHVLEDEVTHRTQALEYTLNELNKEIHERELSQHLAEESEEKYRQLFSCVDEAILLYDAETLQIIDANRAAAALYGYNVDEFKMLTMSSLMRRFPAAEHTAHPSDDSATPMPCLQHVTRQGDIMPVELSTGSFWWKGRKVVFAFVHNIQARLAAEAHLKLSAQVFESANEAIMVADAHYHIVMVNKAFSRITGYSAEEVMQQDSRLLPAHSPDFDAILRSGRQKDERCQYHREILHRKKSGEEYCAWENLSTVRNADGSIAYYVSVFSDITQLKTAEAKSNYLAHHDSLTHLPNRLLFNARLEQSLQLAKRHDTRLALLFLDLDRFKYINDTMGHASGDVLLREIALRIQSCVREQDTVARLGGDEFTVLLSEIQHEQDAANLARKILHTITRPIMIDGREIVVSTSIGISLFPNDGDTATDLIKAADVAMYCAKDRGRHKFEFYTRELTQRSEERLQLEHDIRDNLATGNFFLCYQPQFDLFTGRIIGAEALLRWRHNDGSVSSPEKIIAIAEESSLILDLDAWVLRAACKQAAQWHRSGLPVLKVAVNFSAMNLIRDDFALKVQNALEEFALPPEWIELEVTEGVLQSGSNVIRELKTLKNLGVTLAIDDFGTGYSSLSSLKSLPIDRIKIDKSFITDVPTSQSDSGITQAIITMGHNLNLKVIAEGVENDEQWRFLRTMGCDEVQGFRFGRPETAAYIPTYLNKIFTPQQAGKHREIA